MYEYTSFCVREDGYEVNKYFKRSGIAIVPLIQCTFCLVAFLLTLLSWLAEALGYY